MSLTAVNAEESEKRPVLDSRALSELKTQGQALIASLDNESFHVRDQASRELQSLLFDTAQKLPIIPTENLNEIGIGSNESRQGYTPEQRFRLEAIEKELLSKRFLIGGLALKDLSCQGVVAEISRIFKIKVETDLDLAAKNLKIKKGVGYSFCETIAALCRETNSIPKYKNSFKEEIQLHPIPKGHASYLPTECGLFTFLKKQNGDIELYFLSDPSTDIIAFDNLESGPKMNVTIFNGRGCINCMDGKVYPLSGVNLLPNTLSYKLGEIKLNVWIAHDSKAKTFPLESDREVRFNHNSYLFKDQLENPGFSYQLQTKAFPHFDWPSTTYRFDALSTLNAAAGSLRFYDREGKEVMPLPSNIPATLTERTIIQSYSFPRVPVSVAAKTFSSLRQFKFKFFVNDDSASVQAQVGVYSALLPDGSKESPQIPQRLSLVFAK